MAKPRLLHPDDVRERLFKRFATQQRRWLAGEGVWPVDIPLGMPREADAQQHPDAVTAWVSAWQRWQGRGTLEWQDRQWRALGAQRLPIRLSLAHSGEVTGWLGESERWERAQERFHRLTSAWPGLAVVLPNHYGVLAGYGEADFDRLIRFIDWLSKHPRSNLYPRQLPIPGIDTKWIDGRARVLRPLAAAVRGDGSPAASLYDSCGLRTPPALVRLRILDPDLRRRLGGLSDVTAPLADIAHLDWPVRSAFIVENQQTGLSFDDLPGSVVFMGMGYSVEALGQLPWLDEVPCVYWGDIDTHGFAILNRARSYLPQIESGLMNESTLLENRELWTRESRQHSANDLPYLTVEERNVYQGLKKQRWGVGVRLEQERIPWPSAWARVCKGLEYTTELED